jgi:hypothetical protein
VFKVPDTATSAPCSGGDKSCGSGMLGTCPSLALASPRSDALTALPSAPVHSAEFVEDEAMYREKQQTLSGYSADSEPVIYCGL